jgi:hypothetical protein
MGRRNGQPSIADAAAVRAQVTRRKASRKSACLSNASTDATLLIPEADILAAVSSLYDDELRPYGRLVRKRLAEHAAAKMSCVVEGDLSRLRRACESSMWIEVRPEEGGEWCALLVGRAENFVDIYNGPDVYPELLWMELAQYMETLDGDSAVLPGGRYSCALALWELGLPCLANRSLGAVVHIVQLAMSDRKLLGYLDGTIAPYHRSQSMLKDTAAEKYVHNTAQQLPLATWSTARACLKEVLDSAVRKGKNEVPLSNLKRLFRSRFHVELSETALGYTKISDLLQDPQLSDICYVQLLERGYVVWPRACPLSARVHSYGKVRQIQPFPKVDRKARIPQVQPPAPSQTRQSGVCRPQLTPLQLPKREAPEETPVVRSWPKGTYRGSVVRNTFIHAIDPALPEQNCRRRAQSVPKNYGSEKFGATTCVIDFMDRSSTRSGDGFSTNGSSTDIPLSPTMTASPIWTPRFRNGDDASSNDDLDAPLSPTRTASPCWTPRIPSMEVGEWGASNLQELDSAFMLHALGGSFSALGGAMTSYSHDSEALGQMEPLTGIEAPAAFGSSVFFPAQPTSPSWTPRCSPETSHDGDDSANRIPLCLAHFV